MVPAGDVAVSDPKPWFQSWPIMVTAGVAALGALGTVMVKGATYITLPEKVEAGEQKNVLQDQAIVELKKSNEIWQDIYQRQETLAGAATQAAPPIPDRRGSPPARQPVFYREYDERARCWECRLKDHEACWTEDAWTRCLDG